jgi:hypothetical protein
MPAAMLLVKVAIKEAEEGNGVHKKYGWGIE